MWLFGPICFVMKPCPSFVAPLHKPVVVHELCLWLQLSYWRFFIWWWSLCVSFLLPVGEHVLYSVSAQRVSSACACELRMRVCVTLRVAVRAYVSIPSVCMSVYCFKVALSVNHPVCLRDSKCLRVCEVLFVWMCGAACFVRLHVSRYTKVSYMPMHGPVC